MRRERLPGKGGATRPRRKREHPRAPARRASTTVTPRHPTDSHEQRGTEWDDPLTEQEKHALEAGWRFLE